MPWDADLRRVVMSRSVTFEATVTDTVVIDTDSDGDEEVQTTHATEGKSVSVLAQPSDDSGAAEDSTSQESNDSLGVTLERSEPQQEPMLRHSSRISQPPRPLWIAPSHTAILAIVSANVATEKCSLPTDVPQTYEEATSPGNADFWKPAIGKEELSITRNKTWDVVKRTQDMNALPCLHMFNKPDPKNIMYLFSALQATPHAMRGKQIL